MACSYYPDDQAIYDQAIYATPASPPLTCLVTLDNPKATNLMAFFVERGKQS